MLPPIDLNLEINTKLDCAGEGSNGLMGLFFFLAIRVQSNLFSSYKECSERL